MLLTILLLDPPLYFSACVPEARKMKTWTVAAKVNCRKLERCVLNQLVPIWYGFYRPSIYLTVVNLSLTPLGTF